MIFVGSRDVEQELVGELLVEYLQSELPFREVPGGDRVPTGPARWKSGSAPLILTASFHSTDCRPCVGFQWNLTNVAAPSALTSWKVWTPKPSMNRNDRGMVRSDMIHISMWVDSGDSETKSQKLSCAVWACGKPRSGSCFAAWMRSGNLIASWMKKTGMLLPTRSQLPAPV